MHTRTYADPAVTALAEKFVWIEVDPTKSLENEELMAAYADKLEADLDFGLELPTAVFMTHDEKLIQALSGFVEAADFAAAMKKVLDAGAKPVDKPEPPKLSARPWKTDLDAAIAAAKISGKKVAVLFGEFAVEDEYSLQMRDEILGAPEVAALTDRFEWVLIDPSENEALQELVDAYGERLGEELEGYISYPTLVLQEADGKLLAFYPGPGEAAEAASVLKKALGE